MNSEIEAFFERMYGLLESGQIEALSSFFKTPFPIYRADGLFIEATPAEVKSAMTIIHSSFVETGVVKVRSKVFRIEERPGTSTIRVGLEVQYLDQESEVMRASRFFYFLEPDDGHFKITLVDYDEVGFPEFFDFLERQRRLS